MTPLVSYTLSKANPTFPCLSHRLHFHMYSGRLCGVLSAAPWPRFEPLLQQGVSDFAARRNADFLKRYRLVDFPERSNPPEGVSAGTKQERESLDVTSESDAPAVGMFPDAEGK